MISFHAPIKYPALHRLRHALFQSWWNTLLSFGCLWLIYRVLDSTTAFVLREARWQVISGNLQLFALGSYPDDQLWRVLLSVAFLMGLSGVTRARQGRMGRTGWVFFVGTSGAALWIAAQGMPGKGEGLNAANPFFLMLGLGLYLLGYFGLKSKPPRISALACAWLGCFFVSLTLLSGFEGSAFLPKVPSHLWGGLLLTLLVTAVGIVASFPFGIALALGRRSTLPLIRYFCIAFIEIIRGVPLITLLFMGQVLIPLFLPPGLVLSNLLRVMIAVTFFAAAYMAEYIRGGLQALPAGQVEAARALGLSGFQTQAFIVLPQAIQAVIPALVGECIALFKDTSLVAIVGLLDLTGAAKAAIGQPDFIGREAEVFMAIAGVYWVFSFLMSKYSQRLEAHYEAKAS